MHHNPTPFDEGTMAKTLLREPTSSPSSIRSLSPFVLEKPSPLRRGSGSDLNSRDVSWLCRMEAGEATRRPASEPVGGGSGDATVDVPSTTWAAPDSNGKARELSSWESDLRRREADIKRREESLKNASPAVHCSSQNCRGNMIMSFDCHFRCAGNIMGSGKVHGGRLSFGVFHWTAPLLSTMLFGIGTVSSSPSSALCLLFPVALMILVAFEPRSWCGSMAIVPWLSG
ncbi:hypothetical protein ZWY2020_024898 [Hordeum vulgare]|nr:hypothetical protein ZWY2020_024898 [Hordeum vulgare]